MLEDTVEHFKKLPVTEKIRIEKMAASVVAKEYEKILHKKIDDYYNLKKKREKVVDDMGDGDIRSGFGFD